MPKNLRTGGPVRRALTFALAATLSLAVVSVAAVVPAQAQTPAVSVSATADLAAAHRAAPLVAAARSLAMSPSAGSARLATAMAAAQAALAHQNVSLVGIGGLVHPDTDNANGHSCHWYGYCDFRLSDSRARQLVDLLNVGAGGSALCAVIAVATGGIGAVGCGAVSAILWTASGWISYLVDHYGRGIFIRVFYTGGGYIWHQ